MQQNSLDAYYNVVQKDLNKRQKEVLLWFDGSFEWTNRDIANNMGLAINNITPRTGELRDAGYIEKIGNKIVAKGRKHAIYRITEKGNKYLDEYNGEIKLIKKSEIDPEDLYRKIADDYAIELGWDNWEELLREKAIMGHIGSILNLEVEIAKTFYNQIK